MTPFKQQRMRQAEVGVLVASRNRFMVFIERFLFNMNQWLAVFLTIGVSAGIGVLIALGVGEPLDSNRTLIISCAAAGAGVTVNFLAGLLYIF